ncbi:UbiE family methyltransferase [Xylona heveae TC161]|uniref:UbiE family methyltransferase n=1 Tax=Xylona heveae (strain CBS 132557 / TC161) TaxID=1328760 RepID=A0A161TFJ0_XYLHT|nr:UbiE family methyltransferase [Xylona heveae TC161]KZF24807.1 UbiE family methyltransferase [Xylona heveae TC161]
MSEGQAIYTSGHHDSVLALSPVAHCTNSAAYLLKHLRPDFASMVPGGRVVGLENEPSVLEQGRAAAEEKGIRNVEFVVGDVFSLDYPDNSFDVVHCHQVLQHVGDPVAALREMRRVAKPGGLVAAREGDFSTMTWYPDNETLGFWKDLYIRLARANGGEPDAGRRLHVWANKAGFDWSELDSSSSTWLFRHPDDRLWWSSMWADRTVASRYAQGRIERGFATKQDLDRIADEWRSWGQGEDAWFTFVHGEIVCHVR